MIVLDILMWLLVIALFPLWASAAVIIIVFPFAFVYHLWSVWFSLIRDSYRRLKNE